MKVFAILVTCLLCVATSASGAVVFEDDFESYAGWTANNGNGWFNSTNETNYDANGWLPYYSYGAERDPGMVVASGGPHSGSSSGYGDSQGFTQWDGGTPHGQAHLINADGSAVPAGGSVTFSALVNNTSTNYTRLQIGSSGLTSAGVGDDQGSAIISSAKGLQAGAGGPEPSTAVDWSEGWKEVSVTALIGDAGIVEEIVASWRNIGDASWNTVNVGAGPAIGAATHFGFDIGQGTTIDNLKVDVIPEPAALSMLVMGLLGLGLLGRHSKNG